MINTIEICLPHVKIQRVDYSTHSLHGRRRFFLENLFLALEDSVSNYYPVRNNWNCHIYETLLSNC